MTGVDCKVFLLLAGSGVCTVFGGLQSVGVLEWLQPLLLLQFLHHVNVLDHKPVVRTGLLLLTLFIQTLGCTIAYAGEFKDPDFNVLGIFTSFCLSLLFWVILIFVFVTSLRYQKRFPRAYSSHPFAFPCVWTLVWHLESSFAPIGTTANPAYTQYGFTPMVLTVALWGLDGIVFFMALTATLAHQRLLLRQEAGAKSWIVTTGVFSSARQLNDCEQQSGPAIDDGALAHKLEINEDFGHVSASAGTPMNAHEFVDKVEQHDRLVKLWGSILILSLLYSGSRKAIFSGGFFEKGIIETYKPTVGVSCILKQPPEMVVFDKDLDSREFLWNATAERAKAGDGFIIWSETATFVDGRKGELELLSNVREILSVEHEARKKRPKAKDVENDNWAPFVGLSYAVLGENKELNQPGSSYNVFTLMLPNGSIGFRYTKSNPVPFVEVGTIPGLGALRSARTSFGRVSAAICFDFQFPRLLAQTSYMGVDIVLQPSWTWGPMANQQLRSDAFRAVENGFTLVRCSSMGQSAVVTPFYEIIDLRESINSSVATMQLPISPRVWTLYPFGGYLFGMLVSLVAAIYIFMTWLPLMWVHTVANIFPGSVKQFFLGCSSSQEKDPMSRVSTRSEPFIPGISDVGRPLLSD